MADNVKPLFPHMAARDVEDAEDDSGIPGLPWSHIMGLVMAKLGQQSVVIDRHDVERILAGPDARTVVVHDTGELLIVRLMTNAEAAAYTSMAIVPPPPKGQPS